MAETRIAQVIDRLLVLTRAQSGWRGPEDVTSDSTMTTVYDGPEIASLDDNTPGPNLVIGYSLDADRNNRESANSSFTGGPLAATNRPRDEVATISCMSIAQNYETPKLARDAALGVIAAVSAICRADPSLGINTADTIGGVRTLAYVTTSGLNQYLHNGYTVEWEFTVSFQSRV